MTQQKCCEGITVDEHGLSRLPDGRRWVEVIHAPRLLEHASHVMPWVGFAAYFLLADVFTSFATWNIAIHIVIFAITVHIPSLLTGKMSWIDLSWPLGLLSLGLSTWFLGTSPLLRRAVVGTQYFMIGGRMAYWFLANWAVVAKGRELPRYQYRRLVWEDKPFFHGLIKNTALSMQLEISEQWVWNSTWLCLPAMLHSFDTESLSFVEFLGLAVWILSIVGETVGDAQKFGFVMDCKKHGVEARLGRTGGEVCDVGLWRYTRHPNYFFQWLGWVGITFSSIPALLRLQGSISTLAFVALAAVLLYIPVGSYLMMVYYTGSIPAEVYTVQTRPAYKEYQETTNMFFPGPPRFTTAKTK